MTQYKELIDQTIATIINQFHRKPHNFFNEHEQTPQDPDCTLIEAKITVGVHAAGGVFGGVL